VAVVFVCATIWKLAAGQYLDGSFLYWTFLTDDRLQRLAATFAGVPLTDVAAAADGFRVFAALGSAGDALAVPAWHRLDVTAATLSWFALLTEGAVGVLHLTGTRRLYLARHVSVIAFIIATYSLVPVAGFAFVLAILGVAQTEPSDVRLRLCYVGVMGWIHMTMLPWQQLL
jgi:hypothetical protein